jgi:hypothetical protein
MINEYDTPWDVLPKTSSSSKSKPNQVLQNTRPLGRRHDSHAIITLLKSFLLDRHGNHAKVQSRIRTEPCAIIRD